MTIESHKIDFIINPHPLSTAEVVCVIKDAMTSEEPFPCVGVMVADADPSPYKAFVYTLYQVKNDTGFQCHYIIQNRMVLNVPNPPEIIPLSYVIGRGIRFIRGCVEWSRAVDELTKK
jgi:hypothetical protein